MTARHKAAGAALAVLLALPPAARAQVVLGEHDSATARVDSVFRALDRTDSPGCAVGVYRDGRIVYARGYGMASLELGSPITPYTVFDIGSVSKQFTATSLLLLQQDGRLRLDDPLRRYVPDLPRYVDSVTLRQALTHTAGLRDYLVMGLLAGGTTEGVADTVDYLRLITRSATTNFPPGTRFLYSNSGYMLAATIVYRLTGEPLSMFARERIFAPLGMQATHFHDDHAMVVPNRATGYAPRQGGGYRIQMSQFDGNAGPGGLHTTVEDLARWDGNFVETVVGGPEVVQALTTPGIYRDGRQIVDDQAGGYGLGLSLGTWRGLRRQTHNGSWAGYRAAFNRFPDQHLSVATLCNLTTAGPESLALKVAAIYLRDRLAPDSGAAWAEALLSAPWETLGRDSLGGFAGIWRNQELGEVRRTRLDGDRLLIGIATPTPLIPLGGNRFRLAAAPTEATFEDASGSTPARLVLRTRSGATAWERVPGMSPTDGQLAEYAGDYTSEELGVTYTLQPDSGGLALWLYGRRRSRLEPTYRDAFSDGGRFAGYLEFQRDARGRITGFVLQAGRVRNLPFRREPLTSRP